MTHSQQMQIRFPMAIAMGAFAIGALAVGYLAINKLAVKDARFRRLEIDELVVRRVRRTRPAKD